MPSSLTGVTAVSANCTPSGPGRVDCKPESPSRLRVEVNWPYSPLPHCAVQYSWTFENGGAPVVTSEPFVEHVFPLRPEGSISWTYPVTVAVGSFQKTLDVRSIWGTMTLSRITPSVTEGGPPARLAITRTDATPRVTVKYATSSMPEGYLPDAVHQVTFEPGESRKELVVPVIDDDVYRSDDAIGIVGLDYGAHGYAIDQDFYSFRITDDDEPVRHRFVQRSPRVREGTALALDIDRTGNTSQQTTAIVEAQGVTYTVPFAPGVTRNRVTIPIPDDTVYNGARSFKVSCVSQGLPGLIDSIPVEIIDDEPVPQFTPKLIEIHESDAAQSVPIVIAVAPQFAASTWVVVKPETGTATTNDFIFETTGFYWSPLQESQTLVVSITGDDVAENDETFTLHVDGPGEIGDTITVRILDDDRPAFGFAFAQVDFDVNETNAAVDVRRTDGSSSAATVTLRVHGRFPSFWTIDDIELSFAPGETQKRVPLPVDDGLYTGTRLATLELKWNGFAGASAELTLTDDETMPTLTLGDATVVEGAPGTTSRLEFPATLSGPVGTDILFQLTTHDGTAAGASDYTPLSNAVVAFPQGRTTAALTVFVRGDAENEANETLTLEITGCCSQLAQLVKATATGTIRNDDGGGGDPSAYTLEAPERVNESYPWLEGTVTRTNEARQVAYVTVRLTAGLGRQFTPVTLRFAAHETKKDVRFYLDDHFYSGDGMALLEVFSGGQLQAQREVLIRENEPQPVIRIHGAPPLVTGDALELHTRFALTVEPPLSATVQARVSMPARVRLHSAVDRVIDIPPFTSRVEVPVLVYPDGHSGEATLTLSLDLWWTDPPAVLTAANRSATAKLIFTRSADATLQPYAPMFAAGTARTLTLSLYPAAVGSEPLQLTSSKTNVATVPATVAIPPGATSVTFDVAGHAKGDATVTITLPPYFQNKILTVPLSVYEPFTAVVEPQILLLRTGETRQLNLSTLPRTTFAVQATATAANPSIVFVDQHVAVGQGGAVVEVYGANEGETEIIITFPEDGGTTLRVPVKVTKGSTKRRSAR